MLDPGTDVLFSVSGPILGKKKPAAVNICIVYRYIVTIYRYKIFSWDIINCYRILLQNILRDIVVWYHYVIYILLVDIVWDILMKYWLLKISLQDICFCLQVVRICYKKITVTVAGWGSRALSTELANSAVSVISTSISTW